MLAKCRLTTANGPKTDSPRSQNGFERPSKRILNPSQNGFGTISKRILEDSVQGLADDLDIKRICKAFKKNFSCNGAVVKDDELGTLSALHICCRVVDGQPNCLLPFLFSLQEKLSSSLGTKGRM